MKYIAPAKDIKKFKKVLFEQFYDKQKYNETTKETLDFYTGKVTQCSKIIKKYVLDIMTDTVVNTIPEYPSYSIRQLYENKYNLLDKFIYFYNLRYKNKISVEQYCKALSMSITYRDENKKGFMIKKPGFYNTDTVYNFLYRYTKENDNYYDGSCGWGNRLCGALKANVNYFGTDPNYVLTVRLNDLYNEFSKITNCKNTCDIKTQGSEIFIPEYENKMDVAFTCPPYFFLEEYNIGKQSCSKNTKYTDWLNDFMYKTIDNTIAYLKPGAIYAITVKNFGKYKIYDDVKNYLDNNNNLDFIELMEEKLSTTFSNKTSKNVEYIQIYRKKSAEPLVINKRNKTLLDDFLV